MNLTLKQRLPFIIAMSMGGAAALGAAVEMYLDGQTGNAILQSVVGVCVLWSAVSFARLPNTVPAWAHRFEVVAAAEGGHLLRCNRCDTTVLPWAAAATLPRLWLYAEVHYTQACPVNEPRIPGESTGAHAPIPRPKG